MAALDSSKSVRLSAYAALGTLLFISPHSFLADVVAHVESRLNNPDFLALGEAELGIMETQPGQLYIDGTPQEPGVTLMLTRFATQFSPTRSQAALQLAKARVQRWINGMQKCAKHWN